MFLNILIFCSALTYCFALTSSSIALLTLWAPLVFCAWAERLPAPLKQPWALGSRGSAEPRWAQPPPLTCLNSDGPRARAVFFLLAKVKMKNLEKCPFVSRGSYGVFGSSCHCWTRHWDFGLFSLSSTYLFLDRIHQDKTANAQNVGLQQKKWGIKVTQSPTKYENVPPKHAKLNKNEIFNIRNCKCAVHSFKTGQNYTW